ncbi:MAG: ribonuclease H-like YkuK family protein, partial [Patescibacteria group bacterium]
NLIQEVVGMVRANNFEAKTKPDSYAASKVADRHV